MKKLISPLRALCRRIRNGRKVRRTSRILAVDYGHALSVQCGEAVDAGGREIPWFTYPAIGYIDQLDFRAKHVFEYGAGNSTFYWAQRAARVVSVENDRNWYCRIKLRKPDNVDLMLIEATEEYPRALVHQGGLFDVIIIDGIERRACCDAAVKCLRPGGIIVLDNSDWHHICAQVLRETGLIQVDMSGFGPINDYTWTTSFFFHREFSIPGLHGRQPLHGIGSLAHCEGAP